MYTEYYNLKEKPFEISPDPKFAWLVNKHAEALAIMEYGIKENTGFLLLTGDVGVGKTLMVNCLMKTISSNIVVAMIANPKMAPVDFFNYLSSKLGWEKRFNTKGKFLVNIFIVGQKELEDLVNKQRNKSLRERISLRYYMKPLSENETDRYIKYPLGIAGSENDIFKSDAIQKVHFFSKGIPRRINMLCDQALLIGFVTDMKEIDGQVIEKSAQNLRIIINTNEKENLEQQIEKKVE
jgi:general secretion pathway protein A